MVTEDLQDVCEQGQWQLSGGEYAAAERTLSMAEERAWKCRDYDTLSRLYMPLQEARRQRRQRCMEGVVRLDLIAEGAEDRIEGWRVVERYPMGQLLVGGWGSIEPALEVRRLAAEHGLYVEVFLGAAYPTPDGRVVAVVPEADAVAPGVEGQTAERLLRDLSMGSLLLREREIPRGDRKGCEAASAQAMAMWERLHAPFLNAAEGEEDPILKMEGYRRAIRVDYGCELAHQRLAAVARELARGG